MYGLKKTRILVVEDDLRMCESLRYLLRFYGFDVHTSGNLPHALEALVDVEYDLILLDLQLETQSGLAVMDHLADSDMDTRVIVVTGYSSENNAIQALKQGAADYIKKPFEPDDLIVSIQRVLDSQRRQRELRMCQRIAASSSLAIAVSDRQGRVIYANAAYHGLTQPTATVSNGIPVDDKHVKRAIDTGSPWEGTIDAVDAAGHPVVLWKRAEIVCDPDGRAVLGLVVLHDITNRVEVERAVASSRERYRRVVDSQKDFVCRLDPAFKVTFVNKALADYWGDAPRHVIGRSYMALAQDSIQHLLEENLMAVRSGAEPIDIEYTIRDAGGHTRWQRWRFHGIVDASGRVAEIQGIGRDVTRNKRRQQQTEEKKRKFRNLAEITSDWIWEVDLTGVYTYASPVVEEILGYRPEEVVGKRPFDFMPENEARRLEELFQQALATGQPLKNIENVNRHKNGALVTLETSGVPIFDHRGLVIGYRGVDRNISGRKLAEQRLREESYKLKQALTQVKRLSGMLPICASCKMIRDDRGYWNQIEEYIQTHSEAEFSHGICPKCAKELYPELYEDD